MPNGGSPMSECGNACGRAFRIYGRTGEKRGDPVITSHHGADGGGRYVGRWTMHSWLCFGCSPVHPEEYARWKKTHNGVPAPGARV